jgi:hypothetical protein
LPGSDTPIRGCVRSRCRGSPPWFEPCPSPGRLLRSTRPALRPGVLDGGSCKREVSLYCWLLAQICAGQTSHSVSKYLFLPEMRRCPSRGPLPTGGPAFTALQATSRYGDTCHGYDTNGLVAAERFFILLVAQYAKNASRPLHRSVGRAILCKETVLRISSHNQPNSFLVKHLRSQKEEARKRFFLPEVCLPPISQNSCYILGRRQGPGCGQCAAGSLRRGAREAMQRL